LAPSFTAAGKRIAYSGNDGGDLDIFTIPATGGTPRQLTDNSTEDLDPDYSPDGSRIVYTHPDGDGDREIFTISATGGTPSQLTDNGTIDQWPVYSPDGSRIAYSNNDGGDFEIFTMPATGGQRHPVTDNLRDDIQPSWQPRAATKVPEVVGYSSSGAGRAIRNAGLVPKFTGDPPGANARVVSQRPSPGTLVDPGSTVTCRLTNKGDPF
jgi:Tol biopolymer transport system component